MALFVARHRTALAPAEAWRRLTDWPRHGAFVPFTTITVTPPGPSDLGTVFTARTAIGGRGFDDPMEIVEWHPPTESEAFGRCRIEKRGDVMRGWAELTVTPSGEGSLATWTEEISVARVPRMFDGATRTSSRLMFGRVLRKLLAD